MRLNKILFILHLPPPVHGSSLMGLNIKESKIINNSYDCNYINLGTSKTIEEIGKNPIGKIFRYLAIIGEVFKALIIHRPAICYFAITVKGAAFYKDALIVLIVKLFRVQLVYHLHNKGITTRRDRYLDNLLYRIVFKNAQVILLSPHLYPDIQKYAALDAVYYCPNCADGTLSNDAVTRQKKENDISEIIFLGNMIESKGVYILLDACKILKQKNIPCHCTFIGSWSDITEKQFSEKVMASGLTNDINCVGRKIGNEKNSFIAQADIFAFPTYYGMECFPLVLLEAMQSGLPVVSTFEGGIADIVEDGVTGFLVPQRNSIMLADKLEILLLNRTVREDMGKKGRIRYEQNFTLQHFENNLVAILNKCLLSEN